MAIISIMRQFCVSLADSILFHCSSSVFSRLFVHSFVVLFNFGSCQLRKGKSSVILDTISSGARADPIFLAISVQVTHLHADCQEDGITQW